MTRQITSDFPKSQLEHSIAGRFEMLAAEIPTQLALKDKTVELSYEALNRRANKVAHALLDDKSGTETVVVLVENPINQVVAQLGVLKAGKACVPLDPSFPPARQTQILADSKATIIVTAGAHGERANELVGERHRIVAVDELDSSLSLENPGGPVAPDALAYVLYTSGSTGTPKGVMQSHRNLLHVAMLYHRDLGIGLADRMTSPTSLVYTGTVWALLAALMNRAAFICTGFDSPIAFAQTLTREKITTVQLITTLLRQFMQAFDQPLQLSSLRKVYTGGETLHKEDVARFARTFPPHCGLLYNFGSTEAGIITHHLVNLEDARQNQFQQGPDDPAFPVGYPVEDTEILLVDEHAVPVSSGQDGEIAVLSNYLSLGYWADPHLTRKHFRAGRVGTNDRIFLSGDLGRLRLDGCLEYLGRKDFQVKIRGFRVEVTEVETALLGHPNVRESTVMAQEGRLGDKRLVVYLVPRKKPGPSISELRGLLKEKLPDYMIPSAFVMLNALPLTPAGKIDRKALPLPSSARPELDTSFVTPTTPVEEELAGIWAEVVGVDQVGIHDNFLDLGGHSLQAQQIINRVLEGFHVKVPLRSLFESSTVADMAVVIRRTWRRRLGRKT